MQDTNNPTSAQSVCSPFLASNHLADLQGSGLSDQQIAACGFHSIFDPREVANILRSHRAERIGPCLVIPYREHDGTLIPVRDFARLKPDTPRLFLRDGITRPVKYESPRGSTNKIFFPPTTCGILADTNIPLVICEGEKKAAKADQEGFVCIGLSGVESWSKKRETGPDGKTIGKRELLSDFDAIALHGRKVFVVFDSDIRRKVTVRRAANSLARALRERGAIVSIVLLPDGPPDTTGQPSKVGLDDFLVTHSTAALQQLLDESAGQPDVDNEDDRTVIHLSTNEANVNDAVIDAIARSDQLYQRGGRLVRVIECLSRDGIDRPEGVPRLMPLALAGLREELTRCCQFFSTADGKTKLKHPPKWCYEAVAARGTWPPGIRQLTGIVTAPVLKRDGSLLTIPGYDAQTGLLYDSQGVEYPIVECPSRDDAIRAVEALLDVVADFPFLRPEHRAAWLAYLLTAASRFGFSGPAPLFLFDANTRGSGKTLLVDVVAVIVTGKLMPRMANPKDDDEARKRITALALAGDSLVLIDNVDGELGSAALDAALTATSWKDRILKASEIVELPLQATWAATGNNVILKADTSRRAVHIRLDSPLESPEQRQGFRFPKLLTYVRDNRAALLSHTLTILSAYCRAGRPQQELPNWGSFEAWSDLVRQCIVWCGLADPGTTRTELNERSDGEAAAYRDLVAGWTELDPMSLGLTAAEILSRLVADQNRYHQVRDAIAELCPSPMGRSPSPKSLGNKLRHFRRRVVGDHYLDSRQNRRSIAEWFVAAVSPAPVGSTAGSAGSAGSPPARRPRSIVVGSGHVAGSAGCAGSVSVGPSRAEPGRTGGETVTAGSAGFAGSVSAPPARDGIVQCHTDPNGDRTETDSAEPAEPAEPASDEVEVF